MCKKKSQFSHKIKINVENSKGERRGGAFARPPLVRAHRQAAMAVPTVSEGESQAMRDSLPQRSPPPVQEEGSQVTEASVQAQIEQQQRRGTKA